MLLAMLPQRQVGAAEETKSDVRVIVDVSGSMKKNDPSNLRAPAIRMVVGLMPEDAHAGVWTFAKMVNMLVAWKPVSDNWRESAIEQSNKIHSFGLFTDIEQVLKKATANQKQANPRVRRSIILLSDGFVDLQAGEAASQQSRQRILEQLVAKFKKTEVAVHTIALSDKADHELLKALSMATDGWYQRADTAEDLQRIFLHLFEKATQPDTVPLADNQFKIDDTISEMTVLAFRKPNTEATTLTLPDGSQLTQAQQSGSVRWQHDSNYDLITIDKPQAGRWQINAELDPDNRVMVVTDMKLATSDLPNNVLLGEKFDIEASLTEKGEIISREGFLNLVDGELVQQIGDQVRTRMLQRLPTQSTYRATLGEDFNDGRHDVIITMKSATFERQRRQSVNVISGPINVDTQQLDQASRSHRIEVQADSRLIKPETLSITALLRSEDGSEWPYDMLKTEENNWRLTLTDLEDEAPYQLSLQLRGETPEGRQVFLQPEALSLCDDRELVVNEQTPVAPATQPETSMTEDVEQTPITTIAPEPLKERDAEARSMSDTTKLLIGNGMIVLLLVLGIFWWRKQSTSALVAGDLI